MATEIEYLERIVRLETRLATTIEKLDKLIDAVEKKHDALLRLYNGDEHTPSLHSRLLIAEDFIKTARWTIGILYVSAVAIIFAILKERI